MGNVVGSISFDAVEHHRFHKLIGDLKEKHNLTEEVELARLKFTGDNRDHYGVHISGLSLWWMGNSTADQTIRSFLNDALEQLEKDGATNVKIEIEHLPI